MPSDDALSPPDPRRFAPATERNREPIAEVLAQDSALATPGDVLELACGTGQHAAYFGAKWPHLRWRPTDRTDEDFASVRAWTAGLSNVSEPALLDACADRWSVDTDDGQVDVVVAINMIHIAPIEAMHGLLAGAGRILRAGPRSRLVMYGPYRVTGEPLAPSNVAFDESLRTRDARWGIRALDEVVEVAAKHGLHLRATHRMPANNLTVLFERAQNGQ